MILQKISEAFAYLKKTILTRTIQEKRITKVAF